MYIIGTVKISENEEVDLVLSDELMHKYRSLLYALQCYHDGTPPECDTIIGALEELLPLWKIIELTEPTTHEVEAQTRTFLFQTMTDTFVCEEHDLSHAIIIALLEANSIKPLSNKDLQKFIYKKGEDE